MLGVEGFRGSLSPPLSVSSTATQHIKATTVFQLEILKFPRQSLHFLSHSLKKKEGKKEGRKDRQTKTKRKKLMLLFVNHCSNAFLLDIQESSLAFEVST